MKSLEQAPYDQKVPDITSYRSNRSQTVSFIVLTGSGYSKHNKPKAKDAMAV